MNKGLDITLLLRNLGGRLDLLQARLRQGLALLKTHWNRIKWLLALDLLAFFGGIIGSIYFQSNMPAQVALGICATLWFIMMAMVTGPLAVLKGIGEGIQDMFGIMHGALHEWTGRPHVGPPPATIEPKKVELWYEASFPGATLYILATIGMYAHLLLVWFGLLPVYLHPKWIAGTILISAMVPFIVATSDLVGVKRWRLLVLRVLGVYAVWLVACMFLTGTTDIWRGWWWSGQIQRSMQAKHNDVSEDQDRQELQNYYNLDREFRERFRLHREHDLTEDGVYDRDWTPNDSAKWQVVSDRIAELQKPGLPQALVGNVTSLKLKVNSTDLAFLAGGLILTALILAKDKSSQAKA